MTWPDPASYLTPGRARALRTEVEFEKQMARELDGPRPAPPSLPTPPRQGRRVLPCSLCGAALARLYVRGWRCASCAPPPAPVPDPAQTLTGLQAKRARDLGLIRRVAR